MKWFFLIIIPMGIGVAISVTDFDISHWNKDSQTGDSSASSSAKPEPRPSATPKRSIIYANGIVEGAQRDVAMRFEIAGRLSSIHVFEGDQVTAGDLLATLDAETWTKKLELAEAKLALATSKRPRLVNAAREETVKVARAEVTKQKVRVAQALNRYKRQLQLKKSGAGSGEELTDRESEWQTVRAEELAAIARAEEIEAPAREDDLAIADAEIAQAKAAVELARTELEKTKLVAPTDGIILQVLGEPGQLVRPLDSDELLVMVDNSRPRTRAFVEELDALSVKPGQRAYVIADGDPDTRHHGVVVRCTPRMVPKKYTHNMPGERIDVKVREVIIELDQQGSLVVGLPVDVFIDMNLDELQPEHQSEAKKAGIVSTDGLDRN